MGDVCQGEISGGSGQLLSPGWKCYRLERCSRTPPDASKEKPTCRQRLGSNMLRAVMGSGPSPAQPIALQKLRCQLRAWLREHCSHRGSCSAGFQDSKGRARKGLSADNPEENARGMGQGSSFPAPSNWSFPTRLPPSCLKAPCKSSGSVQCGSWTLLTPLLLRGELTRWLSVSHSLSHQGWGHGLKWV